VAKSLRDRILEALKKEGLTALELSERIGVEPVFKMGDDYYFTLSRLEEEGLIEYDSATGKWHLKRR